MFGGWRIVKTMGQKITKLKPVGGFCAETGGAITLFLATAGHPGVHHAHHHRRHRRRGPAQRASAVRWGVAGNIVWAWIFTIPGQRVCGGRGVLGQPADFLTRRVRPLADLACLLRSGTRSSAGS
jgi:PiT family inorganic phosphate transporter